MIEQRAAPGIIYSFHQKSRWWSALAATRGQCQKQPATGGQDWYSPGAAWWFRRAMLTSPSQNQRHFAEQFSQQLKNIPFANLAYTSCFDSNGQSISAQITMAADQEWDAWASGAFAVCLPFFSAERCIRKETLATRIKAAISPHAQPNDVLSPASVFDLTSELAALILPFAPWERAKGTPGMTIDRVLTQMGLGCELPFEYPT